jgi:uncharacterized protein
MVTHADQPRARDSKPGSTPAPKIDLKSLPLPEVEKDLASSPDGLSQVEAQKPAGRVGHSHGLDRCFGWQVLAGVLEQRHGPPSGNCSVGQVTRKQASRAVESGRVCPGGRRTTRIDPAEGAKRSSRGTVEYPRSPEEVLEPLISGAVNNPDFCRNWKSEMRSQIMIIALLLVGLSPVARADNLKPLTVLWCSGGGFHDYKNLTPLLTQAIQKYASVRFVVETDYKHWADKGFADKYDAVVYFFSYHDKEAKPVVENIAATIRAGKPALIIHGTLHSFRELGKDRDDFCEAIGLTSVKHDKSTTLTTKKVSDHPITRFWPDDWTTSKDELYQNVKLWPHAKPLMTCYSETSKKDHVVTWINQYGKARVFGTSLGHGKPTTDRESYHRLLANGLLWICDKLDDDGKPKPGYAAETTGAAR